MGQTTDLLVIILIVAIVAVILDGLRRKWRDRNNRVVIKLDRNIPRVEGPEDDLLPNSELPNGGARTLPRHGEAPVPRKPAPALKSTRPVTEAGKPPIVEKARGDAVPVLMDTVELEETDIVHTNVFASHESPHQFEPEEFEDDISPVRVRSKEAEDNEMLDVQVDALDQLQRSGLSPQDGRKPADDDDLKDEEEFEDYEDEEEEDDFDDDEDDFDDDDEDDDFDEDDDEDDEEEDDDEEDEDDGTPRRRPQADDDEWEDEDDWDDEDDDEEDDDEDDWDDEEDEQYSGDYENEPALLEQTYARAASHFSRPSEPPRERIEPGFGEESSAELGDDLQMEDFTDSFQDDELFEEAGQDAIVSEPATARAPADRDRPAREERSERVSFFSKTLLGRQNQAELFQEGNAETAPEEEEAEAGPSEVLIINVMARPGYQFHGEDLLGVVRRQGLQLGEMSIFHRHEHADGGGRVVFSMANMVKPGTFDLSAMDQFATPGVSLFLQLPNRYGNMASFELMLDTAVALRDVLDGELKDENRSVFTRQTIEHSRQRIRDFELAQLSRK